MRIAQINMVPYGSTGKIMLQIAQTSRNSGHEAISFSTVPYSRYNRHGMTDIPHLRYWGSFFENKIHYILGSRLGRNGCFSRIGTSRLINQLKRFKPDVIHLHNLHSFCINLPKLFRYIKKENIRVVWNLHDCWSFTGQCPHFDLIGCEKWKTGCFDCPQLNGYPKSCIDNSKRMYNLKKKWFTGIENMQLVTPSEWLGGLVKQSFLKDYPVKVINNGIDLSVFTPTPSDFRKKYGCEGKKLLLGVSFGWGKRKGLDVFVELAKRLDDSYIIVLVGTDENVDKQLPSNVISIHRTQDQRELAEIYTAADLFVNPTREEVLGMVSVESLACGTPVLTFRTGGSPEILTDTCGAVVDRDDIDSLEQEIIRICTQKSFSEKSCLERAKNFDMFKKFKEYVELYEDSAYSGKRTV